MVKILTFCVGYFLIGVFVEALQELWCKWFASQEFGVTVPIPGPLQYRMADYSVTKFARDLKDVAMWPLGIVAFGMALYLNKKDPDGVKEALKEMMPEYYE